jgi:protein SCO1/2
MWRNIGFVSLIALATPLVLLWAFIFFEPVKVLPKIRPAPGFNLIDQDGRPFGTESLRGAITVYSVTYTGCSRPCPDQSARMVELQAALESRELPIPVRMVTLSIDTFRDTPDVLRAYGIAHGADFRRWTFLTGSEADVRRVAGRGYEVFYSRQPDSSYKLDTRMFLVDGWGILRAAYGSDDYLPSVDRLLRDIRLVSEEADAMNGPASLAYEAAQLFGCFP